VKPLRGTELKRFLRAQPKPRRQLALVLQSVAYPVNVGSIFRIADACRVQELLLTGITPTPPHPKITKVARAKDQRVPWRYLERAEDAVMELRQAGYHVVALELTDASRPYYAYPYPDRVAVVVGNEDHGVTRSVLELCDGAVFVPMFGKGRSLNVHVALAVVCYHILVSSLPA
jgi:23S rRNA (guanosine2251-2'-O)-methyltransferase